MDNPKHCYGVEFRKPLSEDWHLANYVDETELLIQAYIEWQQKLHPLVAFRVVKFKRCK